MKEDKRVEIYAYVMTSANGFAPAVQDGLLTLACCKTRLRYKIGKMYDDKEEWNKKDIYIIGLCGKDPARIIRANEKKYYPIYIARISDCKSVKNYYSDSSSDREDQKYHYNNEKWFSKKNNPHTNSYVGEIWPKNSLNGDPQKRFFQDIFYCGKENVTNFVLLSKDYAYFGSDIKQMEFTSFFDRLKDRIVNGKLYRVGYSDNDLKGKDLSIFLDYFNSCVNKNIKEIKMLKIDNSCSAKTNKRKKTCTGC